jgi:hypothetical protein
MRRRRRTSRFCSPAARWWKRPRQARNAPICNLFLLRTERGLAAVQLWRSIEADRKRPWRIIRKLGPATLLRYLAGRLTLVEALQRLSRLCGAEVAAVASPFGLAAVDVDKPADLDLVRRLVGAQSPSHSR